VLGTIRTKTWQTEDGQRSKFVMAASEVGASLRFAVAEVQKVRTDEPGTDEPPF
jgi:single-stranded DNA-binding protein